LGGLYYFRDLPPVDGPGVRPNRETLYSEAVLDLDAGPATITLPNAGERFLSMIVIDEDHYVFTVAYGQGRHTLTREQVGTGYAFAAVRILVDPSDRGDLKQVHALQDAITARASQVPGASRSRTGTRRVRKRSAMRCWRLARRCPI
jgi:hypothetical protein